MSCVQWNTKHSTLKECESRGKAFVILPYLLFSYTVNLVYIVRYTVLGELLEERDGDQMLKTTISTPDFKFAGNIPTPGQIASKERIFLPPDHLARRAIAFGSPGRTLLDPDELDMLINDVFRGEKYFLVVGQDIKNARGLSANTRQWIRKMNGSSGIDPQEQCHIVLHADAK